MDEPSAYYSHKRRSLVAMVHGRDQVVLELGCATGALAEQLMTGGTAAVVDGVEVDAVAASVAASRMRHVHCADLNSFDLGQLEPGYDVLIAADVLEHLVDPWAVLALATTRVRPGGQVVVSLPNVRYHKVVWQLLFRGKFQYAPAGVLDRTHLRFFTRKSIVELCAMAGLEDVEIVPANSGRAGLKRALFRLIGDFAHPQFYVSATRP